MALLDLMKLENHLTSSLKIVRQQIALLIDRATSEPSNVA